jgi:hypothetical protein
MPAPLADGAEFDSGYPQSAKLKGFATPLLEGRPPVLLTIDHNRPRDEKFKGCLSLRETADTKRQSTAPPAPP